MSPILTIAHLTVHEAARRRILLAALVCGVGFVGLFALGFYLIHRDMRGNAGASLLERRMMLNFFTLAGLYAVNILTVVTSVLLPVDTLSGEIGSGVIQTVAARPVRRSDIVLGKWLGNLFVACSYMLLLAGGVLVVSRLVSGQLPPRLASGLPLMLLEASVLVTLSIAGGTRLSTITNGMVIFGLYGIAFIGGWIEQIGTIANNATARYIGIVGSLLMPSEALWQKAVSKMQPPLMRELQMTPFTTASEPSGMMIAWAAGYVVVVLMLALRWFQKRAL